MAYASGFRAVEQAKRQKQLLHMEEEEESIGVSVCNWSKSLFIVRSMGLVNAEKHSAGEAPRVMQTEHQKQSQTKTDGKRNRNFLFVSAFLWTHWCIVHFRTELWEDYENTCADGGRVQINGFAIFSSGSTKEFASTSCKLCKLFRWPEQEHIRVHDPEVDTSEPGILFRIFGLFTYSVVFSTYSVVFCAGICCRSRIPWMSSQISRVVFRFL